MNGDLQDAIRDLSVPALLHKLGINDPKITNRCVICSPLRDNDRNPSFSIYGDGTRWRDHATGQGGDSFDLYCAYMGVDKKEGWRAFIYLARQF